MSLKNSKNRKHFNIKRKTMNSERPQNALFNNSKKNRKNFYLHQSLALKFLSVNRKAPFQSDDHNNKFEEEHDGVVI